MLPFSRLGSLGGGGGQATVALTDNSVDLGDTTTYTFSSQSLGAAASNRRIIIAVAGDGTTTAIVSTLTVAGISAVKIAATQNVDTQVEIWIAEVPTGATGDVVVTFAGAKARCGIGVYRALDCLLTAEATAGSTADPMSASLFIPSLGIAIGVALDNSTSTHTWTNLTERYETSMETTITHSGASDDNIVPQTPTITCDPSNAATQPAMALASFAPG